MFVFSALLYTLFTFLEIEIGTVDLSKQKILLDISPSMSLGEEGNKSVDQAHRYLEKLDLNKNNSGGTETGFGNDDLKTSIDLDDDIHDFEHVISHFQGFSLSSLRAIASDTTTQRVFVKVGDINAKQNVYIDSLWVSFNPDDFSQRRIELIPGNTDSLLTSSIIFKLYNGDRQLASVVQQADQISRIVFDIPLNSTGEFLLEIDGDEVYFDNRFYFVIGDRNRPVISIIDTESNLYLEEVFSNQNLFEVNYPNPRSLDFELIKGSDVVILHGLDAFSTGLWRQLESKTVLVFPPRQSEGNLTIDGLSLSPLSSTEAYELDVDQNHPLLRGVFKKAADASNFPYATPLYSILGQYESIISLRNSDIFLAKTSTEDYYVFNTSLDLEYSNFAVNSIFLPLLYKIALRTSEINVPPYQYPEDLATIEVKNTEVPPKVISADFEVIPDFNPSLNGIVFEVPQLEPGYYRLVHGSDTFGLAINLAKKESLMKGLTNEELEELDKLSHVSVVKVDNGSESLVFGEESGIWKYALILAFLFLITETLFHRYLQ